jgi:CheY-like chemotaxis protein
MSSICIAIVDDNIDTQSFLRDVCKDCGWDTLSLTDGTTAFEALKESRPDAIVLDLWLDRPDSGWTILQRLKEDPATRDTPVVMCSGNLDWLTEHQALLETDVAAFLVKPFDLNDVIRCLEQTLRLSRTVETRP